MGRSRSATSHSGKLPLQLARTKSKLIATAEARNCDLHHANATVNTVRPKTSSIRIELEDLEVVESAYLGVSI
jgi:hypothetical protein